MRDDIAGDVHVEESHIEKLSGLYHPAVVPGMAVQLDLLQAPLDRRFRRRDRHTALDQLLDLPPDHLPAVQCRYAFGMMRQDGVALELPCQEQVAHVAIDRRQHLLDAVTADVHGGIGGPLLQVRHVQGHFHDVVDGHGRSSPVEGDEVPVPVTRPDTRVKEQVAANGGPRGL